MVGDRPALEGGRGELLGAYTPTGSDLALALRGWAGVRCGFVTIEDKGVAVVVLVG